MKRSLSVPWESLQEVLDGNTIHIRDSFRKAQNSNHPFRVRIVRHSGCKSNAFGRSWLYYEWFAKKFPRGGPIYSIDGQRACSRLLVETLKCRCPRIEVLSSHFFLEFCLLRDPAWRCGEVSLAKGLCSFRSDVCSLWEFRAHAKKSCRKIPGKASPLF